MSDDNDQAIGTHEVHDAMIRKAQRIFNPTKKEYTLSVGRVGRMKREAYSTLNAVLGAEMYLLMRHAQNIARSRRGPREQSRTDTVLRVSDIVHAGRLLGHTIRPELAHGHRIKTTSGQPGGAAVQAAQKKKKKKLHKPKDDDESAGAPAAAAAAAASQ